MRVLALFLVFSFLATPAAAKLEEIALPAAAKQPLAIQVDSGGKVWFTLDGSWAVGRFDPATNKTDVAPLAANRSGEDDALWALRAASDGALWTGSQQYLHRVDPANLTARAFRLPTSTPLGGDVYFAPDGSVWYALVSADALARLVPATGNVTLFPLEARVDDKGDPVQTGPLYFTSGPDGPYVSATYLGTYARLDTATGRLTVGPERLAEAPVGIAFHAGALWAAEHGASSVVRIDLSTHQRHRFPTTPSPFYPISGPNDLVVARDGSLWFTEHFADRVARLDPVARTLHEFELPSAPGANVQFLEAAPDGRVWFALWSKNRIGYVDAAVGPVSVDVPAAVTVQRGASTTLTVAGPGEVKAGSPDPKLAVRVQGSSVVVDAKNAAAGTYEVVVSLKDGPTTAGRYVTVKVEAAKSPLPEAAALAALALAALALGRRR